MLKKKWKSSTDKQDYFVFQLSKRHFFGGKSIGMLYIVTKIWLELIEVRQNETIIYKHRCCISQ